MDICGRDISVALHGGGFRMIQDLKPGDSVKCAGGRTARVVSTETVLGHLYPVVTGSVRIYVAETQHIHVTATRCCQVDDVTALLPEALYRHSAPVLMVKPGVPALSHSSDLDTVNLSVLGRWVNSEPARVSEIVAAWPDRKRRLLHTVLAATYKTNVCDNDVAAIPYTIKYGSAFARFSFLRGVITGNQWRLVECNPAHELIVLLHNKKIVPQLIQLCGSLGYQACWNGVVFSIAGSKKNLRALLRYGTTRLPRRCALVPVSIEPSLQNVCHRVRLDVRDLVYIDEYMIL
jgi:hypothetical protein